MNQSQNNSNSNNSIPNNQPEQVLQNSETFLGLQNGNNNNIQSSENQQLTNGNNNIFFDAIQDQTPSSTRSLQQQNKEKMLQLYERLNINDNITGQTRESLLKMSQKLNTVDSINQENSEVQINNQQNNTNSSNSQPKNTLNDSQSSSSSSSFSQDKSSGFDTEQKLNKQPIFQEYTHILDRKDNQIFSYSDNNNPQQSIFNLQDKEEEKKQQSDHNEESNGTDNLNSNNNLWNTPSLTNSQVIQQNQQQEQKSKKQKNKKHSEQNSSISNQTFGQKQDLESLISANNKIIKESLETEQTLNINGINNSQKSNQRYIQQPPSSEKLKQSKENRGVIQLEQDPVLCIICQDKECLIHSLLRQEAIYSCSKMYHPNQFVCRKAYKQMQGTNTIFNQNQSKQCPICKSGDLEKICLQFKKLLEKNLNYCHVCKEPITKETYAIHFFHQNIHKDLKIQLPSNEQNNFELQEYFQPVFIQISHVFDELQKQKTIEDVSQMIESILKQFQLDQQIQLIVIQGQQIKFSQNNIFYNLSLQVTKNEIVTFTLSFLIQKSIIQGNQSQPSQQQLQQLQTNELNNNGYENVSYNRLNTLQDRIDRMDNRRRVRILSPDSILNEPQQTNSIIDLRDHNLVHRQRNILQELSDIETDQSNNVFLNAVRRQQRQRDQNRSNSQAQRQPGSSNRRQQIFQINNNNNNNNTNSNSSNMPYSNNNNNQNNSNSNGNNSDNYRRQRGNLFQEDRMEDIFH